MIHGEQGEHHFNNIARALGALLQAKLFFVRAIYVRRTNYRNACISRMRTGFVVDAGSLRHDSQIILHSKFSILFIIFIHRTTQNVRVCWLHPASGSRP
jgi:hypothetical protein